MFPSTLKKQRIFPKDKRSHTVAVSHMPLKTVENSTFCQNQWNLAPGMNLPEQKGRLKKVLRLTRQNQAAKTPLSTGKAAYD
jgi:hypothetical protein